MKKKDVEHVVTLLQGVMRRALNFVEPPKGISLQLVTTAQELTTLALALQAREGPNSKETTLSALDEVFHGGESSPPRTYSWMDSCGVQAMETPLRSLLAKIDSLEDEVEERRLEHAEFATKCRELDDELSRVKRDVESRKNQLALANESKKAAKQELQKNNSKGEEVESQLQAVQANATSLITQTSLL
ncbi:hypothetical protein Cgig2_008656 [Carnegiea gigantea]|uniref:Uncharacterized protein n=1 Tax=Carnegiea gigantea TaxID=171969 RepID=A0A9Q1JMS0_9CARY|nr:hypothetical protein Cgig2_008656 [Carnegiea gigantea]